MKAHHKMRAWDKVDKHYLNWPCLMQTAFNRSDKAGEYGLLYKIFSDYEDRYILESCTGIKDKNGKMIFEGDGIPLAGYGLYVAEFPFAELFEAHHENDVGAICGNIHENPELLESRITHERASKL